MCVKNNIKKCYIKYKIEYTEFYLIPIDENDDNKILIINHCLKKIDDARMLNNLSTIQVPFKENYDNNIKNIKFNYEKNNLKDFNKIEDFHQNVNAKNICHLIIVRE